MAKLYLSTETDMIKTLRTARAKDWISVSLHFDDKNYDRAVKVRMYRDNPLHPKVAGSKKDDNIRIVTINGKKACEIDKETGVMWCNLRGKYDFEKEVWEEL